MGKGGRASESDVVPFPPKYVSLEDLHEHNKREDGWLMIDGKAYDISRFAKRHPGGAKIINHYAGQDATDAWTAFHNDKNYVKKFMKALYVGDIKDKNETEIKADFRNLRKHVEDQGLLKVNPWFFILHLGHIIMMEVFAYCLVHYMQGSLLSFFLAAVVLAVAQAASSHWWNFRHFQHHAKPNVMRKDPDIDVAYLFLLGKKIPVTWGKRRKGFMPYSYQHNYWFMIGPPLLLPIYFHIENIMFVFKRRDWVDLLMTVTFFYRWFYCYGPFFGGWGTFALYMFVRFIESHWFTWVTQMSHIPMKIDRDENEDWFSLQLATTKNVETGIFNDWFTGHLNFQIEHHLFPTMPRHNLHKISPLVKSMCKKHNIPYRCTSLYRAFADIVDSLKSSGELWYEAYYEG